MVSEIGVVPAAPVDGLCDWIFSSVIYLASRVVDAVCGIFSYLFGSCFSSSAPAEEPAAAPIVIDRVVEPAPIAPADNLREGIDNLLRDQQDQRSRIDRLQQAVAARANGNAAPVVPVPAPVPRGRIVVLADLQRGPIGRAAAPQRNGNVPPVDPERRDQDRRNRLAAAEARLGIGGDPV